MRHRTYLGISIACFLGCCPLAISPRRADANVLVALAGDVAPDSGGRTILGFEGSPVISDETGALAFKAFLSGGPDSDGVYLYSAGTTAAIATSGDLDPISGSPYVAVGGPRFGPGGDLYFVADVLQGEGGYVRLSAGAPLPFFRIAGDPVPGIAGGVFSDAGFPSFNGSGDDAFIGFFHVSDIHFKGIFRLSGDAVSALVVSGQPAPGTGGGVFTPDINASVLDESGSVLFAARIHGGNVSRGLFRVSGSTTSAVLLSGDPAPGTGGAGFTYFGDPVLNANGDVAFVAAMSGGTTDRGIFMIEQGVVRAVVLAGEPAPGTEGGQFESFTFWLPSLSDSGVVAYEANILGGSSESGIFATVGDRSYPIALAGDPAPGAGGATFSSFGSPRLDALGHVGFQAYLGGSGAREALYLPEPSRSFPIASGVGLLSWLARPGPRRISARTGRLCVDPQSESRATTAGWGPSTGSGNPDRWAACT